MEKKSVKKPAPKYVQDAADSMYKLKWSTDKGWYEDRMFGSKLKSNEVPPNCKVLIKKLKAMNYGTLLIVIKDFGLLSANVQEPHKKHSNFTSF